MAFSSYSVTINMWTDKQTERVITMGHPSTKSSGLITCSSMTVYDSRLFYEYKNRSS